MSARSEPGQLLAVGVAARGEQRQLAQEQRVPATALVQALHEVGRRRLADDLADEHGGLVLVERPERQLHAERPLHRRRPLQVVAGPVRGDHEHRAVGEAPGDHLEEVAQRAVRPLQVVDPEHDRARRRPPAQHRDDGVEQRVARSRGVEPVEIRRMTEHVQQRLDLAPHLRRLDVQARDRTDLGKRRRAHVVGTGTRPDAEPTADRAGERPPHVRLAVRGACAVEHRDVRRRGRELGHDLVDEARLADARLAHDRDDRAATCTDVSRDGVEQGALHDAADERQLPTAPAVAGRRLGADREPHRLDLLAAAQLHGCDRLEPDGLRAQLARRVTDEHRARRRERLQARRHVDDVAHRRVVGAEQRAHEHLAGVDADPQLHLAGLAGPLARERPERLVHLQAGPHGALGVVLVGDRRTEHGHDGVAEQLVDTPAEHLHVGHEALERRIDEALDALGVAVLGECGEPDDVGEHDRDDAALLEVHRHEREPAGRAEPGSLGDLERARRTHHHVTSVRHGQRSRGQRLSRLGGDDPSRDGRRQPG
jgi:hypothetical protein